MTNRKRQRDWLFYVLVRILFATLVLSVMYI